MMTIMVQPKRMDTKDMWVSKEEEEGIHPVKFAYITLQNNCIGENSEVFKTLWSLHVLGSVQHLTVQHLTGKVFLKRIPKEENLKVRPLELEILYLSYASKT